MKNVDAVLGALADPTRRDLLKCLSKHGNATATVLATELPISRQAVVQHLAVLDAVGLVRVSGRAASIALRYAPTVSPRPPDGWTNSPPSGTFGYRGSSRSRRADPSLSVTKRALPTTVERA